jgi:signal transduction histidine kinase
MRRIDVWPEDQERGTTASAARVAGLVLALGAALTSHADTWPGWISVLFVFSFATVSDRVLPARFALATSLVEGALIAGAALSPVTAGIPVYTYLLIPPLVAGLRAGFRAVLAVAGVQYAVILLDWVVVPNTGEVEVMAVWATTGLLLGMLGAFAGRSLTTSMTRVYASAAYEERRRLSREIHDGVAQDLAVLGYRVDRVLLSEPEAVDARDVRGIGQEIRRILEEARWSIHDLRGGRLPEVGLGTALADHVRRAAGAADMTAHLSLTEGTRRLPTVVEMELLRIAQEAVTNARKHSGARNLWVKLDVSSQGALLRVSDDGEKNQHARSAAWPDGFGLAIMRERARSIGADFTYGPRPGGGTVVEARLAKRKPVRGRGEDHAESVVDRRDPARGRNWEAAL